MSVILNIDTALEKAHVSLADDGKLLHCMYSSSQKDHASFLQTAIRELTRVTGARLADIDAVALTAGPGSYTGLRVGLSGAKGLCYALSKPLIMMSTLEVLTLSAVAISGDIEEPVAFCPMIDARRMEVFTAVYKKDLTPYMKPSAMVLDGSSFAEALAAGKVLFFGSGSEKWAPVCKHSNALFRAVSLLPEEMGKYSSDLFSQGRFADLAYSEPFYLKEFQIVIKP